MQVKKLVGHRRLIDTGGEAGVQSEGHHHGDFMEYDDYDTLLPKIGRSSRTNRRCLLQHCLTGGVCLTLASCSSDWKTKRFSPQFLDEPRTFSRVAFPWPDYVDSEKLSAHLIELFSPNLEMSVSKALHWLRINTALTPAVRPASWDLAAKALIDRLLDNRKLKEAYGQDDVIRTTDLGARYLSGPFSPTAIASSRPSHAFQELAVFGEVGLPSRQRIFVDVVCSTAIVDCLTDMTSMLQLRSTMRGEPEWPTQILAYYLADHNVWQNRWHENISIDRWCLYILGREPETFGCGGTHYLMSLVLLMRADDQSNLLSIETRDRLTSRVMEMLLRLTRRQLPDGSWGGDCLATEPSSVASLPFEAELGKTFITGHILEALALLPPEMAPNLAMTDRALALLARSITIIESLDSIPSYCSVAHAAGVLAYSACRSRVA